MSDHLLVYDALECRFTVIKRVPDPDCPICGEHRTINELVEYNISCTTDTLEKRSEL